MLTDASLIYIVLELVIAVLAVLGNVLVCWAVCLNSNLQNITNFFVVSLAVADIAVGLLAIPFAITISTGFCAYPHGCLFIACFVLVLTQSSIFSLLAIAIDRYIAIKIPLRYNSLVTSQRAKGIIAICWVLSIIIGLTPMLGWNNCAKAINSSSGCPDLMIKCLFEEVVTMDYMVYFNFFAFVLVPLIVMLGIYLKIFMAARHQLKQIELKAVHGEKSRTILQKEVHAAKSLAIIVGLFAVCWLPLHIINCFTHFCPGCPRPLPFVMYLAIILSHANSVVNPFIYAYRIREFRCTFRKIIRRNILGRKEHFEGGSTRNSTRTSVVESSASKVNGYTLDLYSEQGDSDSCNGHRRPREKKPDKQLGVNKAHSGFIHTSHLVDIPVSSTQKLQQQQQQQANRELPFQNGERPLHHKSAEPPDMKGNKELSKVQVKSLFYEKTPCCQDLTEVS
ncbi:adenosine receptor A2b [Amia ocellicauda]|uniref:adenosine receptor A2b n=1 Tax=Amia ocellicauda TaxID=2972642 RepID=UPI0034643DAB